MGHAVYTGEDYNPQLYCPFKTPEEVYNFDPFKEYGKMEREKLEKELEKRYRQAQYPPWRTLSTIRKLI